jgi:acid phosphatase
MNVHQTRLTRLALLFLAPSVSFALQFGWVSSWLGLNSKVINEKKVEFAVPAEQPGHAYVRFLALGDFGTGESDQKSVAAAMARTATAEKAEFIVSTGDNVYEYGVSSVSDEQWKTKFEEVYSQPALQIPFYAVFGNHDYRSNAQAQIDYSSRSSRWRFPAGYYTFTRSASFTGSGHTDSVTVQFFCLDTNPLAYLSAPAAAALPDTGKEKRQLRWLDSTLSQSTARWKIVIAHHTIYSGGEHGDNPVLRDLLQPIMERNHTDLYLCGHDHHLELVKPVAGINFIISGAGGKHRDVTWRDNTLFAATNCGYNSFRLSSSEMLVEFFDKDGKLVFAHVVKK